MPITRGGPAAAAVVVLIALAVVGSGCGGDGAADDQVAAVSTTSAGGGTSSTAPADGPSTTATSAGSSTTLEEDDPIVVDLDSVLLTLEDMGADWAYAADEGVPGPSLFETFLQEGQCARPGEPALPQPDDVADVDFSGGAGARQADQVTSTVGRFAASGAEGWFARVIERITICEDPTIVTKEVVPVDGLGDEAVLIHVAADLAPGVATASIDVAVARDEAVVAVVATLTASVDALDEEHLLRTMVARL